MDTDTTMEYIVDRGRSFKPALSSWIFTVLGLITKVLALLFLFFGLIIFYSDIRSDYRYSWTLASIITTIVLWKSGSLFINRFGGKFLTITSESYVFSSPFGKSNEVRFDDIAHIDVQMPNPILELVTLSSPTIIIISYNQYLKVRTRHWNDADRILSHFQERSLEVTDEFAEYYHRSNNSLYLFILRITQDTSGLIGFTILVFFSFLALWGGFAQLLVPPNVLQTHTLFLRNPEFGNYDLPGYDSSNAFDHPPNNDFWFGTDWAGRDVFSRVVFGTSFTFLIAIVGSIIGLFFVIFFGFTSAYFGGWYDNVVMRVSDALLTFPPFIFLVLLATVSVPLRVAIPGGYFLAVYTGMAFVSWPLGARILRSEIKQILVKEYIQAAKHLGSSNFRILYSHVFPKTLPTLLILFSYSFTDIIIGTTILGYIGFSAESTLTWGSDINKAVSFSPDLYFFWWEWLFPTMALFLLVFGLTLFSDSVRDNLDPYLRGGIEAVPFDKRLEIDS